MIFFFPFQLVHAPPVHLGIPSLHSFIKKHSPQVGPGLEKEDKADSDLEDSPEDEADVSVYGKEVRTQGSSVVAAWWLDVLQGVLVDMGLFKKCRGAHRCGLLGTTPGGGSHESATFKRTTRKAAVGDTAPRGNLQ